MLIDLLPELRALVRSWLGGRARVVLQRTCRELHAEDPGCMHHFPSADALWAAAPPVPFQHRDYDMTEAERVRLIHRAIAAVVDAGLDGRNARAGLSYKDENRAFQVHFEMVGSDADWRQPFLTARLARHCRPAKRELTLYYTHTPVLDWAPEYDGPADWLLVPAGLLTVVDERPRETRSYTRVEDVARPPDPDALKWMLFYSYQRRTAYTLQDMDADALAAFRHAATAQWHVLS